MTKQQIKDALLLCSDKKEHPCGMCAYASFVLCRKKLMRDAAEAIEPECSVYDEVEEIENCTVQILRNSKNGAVSVGWWEND